NLRDAPPATGAAPAGLNAGALAGENNPADDRSPPIVIRGNQRSRAIVQLQCRISQCIGNAILRELRAYGTNNRPLWFGPLNNEPSNHYLIVRLHKSACADVA